MDKRDPLTFTKMSGGGNDFVMIDNRDGRIGDAAELTRRVCTRALSVGADGLILIEPSATASVKMRYYNSDGTLAAFCANGTRCAARFAFLNAIAGSTMTIETGAGLVGADVSESGIVTLALQPPRSFQAERPLPVRERIVRGSFIVVGVPHYVVLQPDNLWTFDMAPLGKAIRAHPDLQPDGGANANFVVHRDAHSLEVRTYERGVEAETLSCGSGVVASAITCALLGKVKSPVSVLTRSGITLTVSFELAGGKAENVRLTGDARHIYSATLAPEAVEGFDPEFVRDPSRALAQIEN